MMVANIFAQDDERRNEHPETGWFFEQSTQQAFYMLETVEVDGAQADIDLDVVGAFVNRGGSDICVGWIYAADGFTTVPLMSPDGSDLTSDYVQGGESAFLKLYDHSNNAILDLTPGSDLPGWALNEIFIISGTSSASNTFGCSDETACNYDSSATADDGSCWSANDGCSCDDAQGSTADCAGECNGSAALDDCGVCNGGNASQDCAGVCDGPNLEDNCGVCDDNSSNDDETCTGCTNTDAENYDSGNSIDDGSCVYIVPPATGLEATPGPARAYLNWTAPADDFESTAGYTYEIYQDGGLVKTTTQTSTQVVDLVPEEYCFVVLAVHNTYGASQGTSNESCTTPTVVVGPTWRLQLVAEVDPYNQFEQSGDQGWLLEDRYNYLGVAADGSFGYDFIHDIPEPTEHIGQFVSLYFSHPEWDIDEWGYKFTEDIVLDDDAFFSTNLAQWDGTIESNVMGQTTITFTVETGVVPANYEMYVEKEGDYTRILRPGDDGYPTQLSFYLDEADQYFSVFIGNIVPQAPANLEAVCTDFELNGDEEPICIGGYKSIDLKWDADGGSLNDIRNRYPALAYNVYRDDEPRDPNLNQTTYGPGDGPDGCGGLLSAGQPGTSYLDDADLYIIGEGLLQESTYGYTVTASNLAGESSHGHTVRMSGGAENWHSGRDSRASAKTGDNADPVVVLEHTLSQIGTNLDENGDVCESNCTALGHFEIPHDYDPAQNPIDVGIDGNASYDSDYPYGIDRYQWTQTAGDFDLLNITDPLQADIDFEVVNPHENNAKIYTWNLHVESDHPIKDGGAFHAGSCSATQSPVSWSSVLDTHEHDASLTVTIEDEPNADPDASKALDLIRGGDGESVVTMNNFDDSDFNDYQDGEDYGTDQVWYEPHDGSSNQNNADLWFSADDSVDPDGKCTEGSFGDGQQCDHQNYTWWITQGALAGFSYDDLNGNGSYEFGEPYTLVGGSEIYENIDLGDYNTTTGPAAELQDVISNLPGEVYTSSAAIDGNSSFGYNGGVDDASNGLDSTFHAGSRDFHASLDSGDDATGSDDQEVYILTMKVTDVYGDSDITSVLLLVRDERNSAPTVTEHRSQKNYYMRHDEDTRDVYITTSCDSLYAQDTDNDSQDHTWTYEYLTDPDADATIFNIDGEVLDVSIFNSSYIHDYEVGVDMLDADNTIPPHDVEAWLVEGVHKFTITTTDGYGASNSESTIFTILDEPGAKKPSINIDHTGLKYAVISVNANPWEDEDFPDDACHGDTYSGDYPDYNTSRLVLFNGGEQIAQWDDAGDDSSIYDRKDREACSNVQLTNEIAGDVANAQFIHIDKSIAAETDFTYTVVAMNSELENQFADILDNSASTRTHDRPNVVVDTPNGMEIRSIGDNYDVDFTTYFDLNDNESYDAGEETDGYYINKIDVYYLADGETEEEGDASCSPGIGNPGWAPCEGDYQGSSNGPNVNGCSSSDDCHKGDATTNYRIADNDGVEINYNAKVRIRVTDVGDYDGCEQQTHEDTSDDPFTMAAHTITKPYGEGWHLVGPPLTPWDEVLIDNFSGSLGQWGQEWVAFDVTGQYDGLKLNVGEGYYLALANDETLSQSGDPIIADPDCDNCSDNSFGLADVSLDKGWNLFSNPLVNKVHRDELHVTYQGERKTYQDAVDAQWISSTVFGYFESNGSVGSSYESIDRMLPFGGYFVNTSRPVTLEVRPHLFEDGELTRKSEEIASSTLKLRANDISGESIGDYITVGILEDASDDFVYGEDEYDLPREAYTTMGNAFIDMKIGDELMKDMKSSEYDDYQVWNISITAEIDNDVILSWGDVSGFSDDLYLVIDGDAIDMNEESATTISSVVEYVSIVVGNVDSYLSPVPEAFGLGSAYPNPFNPTTNLELALNQEGMVNMSVFNIRGQVIDVLVDGNMKAGYHNVTWNADGVSSGMYFVRVETGANVAIQKLMLLK